MTKSDFMLKNNNTLTAMLRGWLDKIGVVRSVKRLWQPGVTWARVSSRDVMPDRRRIWEDWIWGNAVEAEGDSQVSSLCVDGDAIP